MLNRERLRGTLPPEIVEDVGLFFPFLNREPQLQKIVHLMSKLLTDKSTRMDLSKRVVFAICNGISGIGKTTFATDGIIYYLDSCVDKRTLVVYTLCILSSRLAN